MGDFMWTARRRKDLGGAVGGHLCRVTKKQRRNCRASVWALEAPIRRRSHARGARPPMADSPQQKTPLKPSPSHLEAPSPPTPKPPLTPQPQQPQLGSPATPAAAGTSPATPLPGSQEQRPLSARKPKPNLKLTVPKGPPSPPIRRAGPMSPNAVSPTARQFNSMEGGWPDGTVTPTPMTPGTPMLSPLMPGERAAPLSPMPVLSSHSSNSSILSPQPVILDMPSPSFDPLLEHFLRPLDAQTMCACVLERAARGKAFRLLVEEGNVLLLVAERRYRDFEILGADGSRVATLHRAKRSCFVLRRATPSKSNDPELAAFVLGDREVRNAPSRPRLNHMRVAAVRPAASLSDLMDRLAVNSSSSSTSASAAAGSGAESSSGGGSSSCSSGGAAAAERLKQQQCAVSLLPAPSPQYTRVLGRPAGELLAALHPGAPQLSDPSLLLLESRLPVWDEVNHLLTLDYPPGRANLASVQNFQLLPQPSAGTPQDLTDPTGDYDRRSSDPRSPKEPDDAAFCATLVHGLMSESEALETFSLDLRHPLSPLLAFAACLAAQDWE